LRRDRWRSTIVPLVVFSCIQLIFELGWMDPADGARYSLPVMIVVALVAALGFGVLRQSLKFAAMPWVATAILAAATLAYVWPLVGERTKVPSPPAAAAAYANANLPPNSVIGYDIALKPHAEYLLTRFRLLPIEKAIAETYDHPEVPLVLYANGASRGSDAHVFTWPASDAYEKLTRQFYRQLMVAPRAARERYLPVHGVYALEWTTGGDEWRWLGPDATIRLPRAHGSEADLTLRFSTDVPYATNVVTISINGRDAGVINVGREPVVARLALPAEALVDVRLRSSRSFSPGALLHNQDPRTLAVQLTGVVTK